MHGSSDSPTPASRTDVLVIGGGIIGMACADELARRGIAVTVIDRGEIGHGCSYGNAGWITPCFALPLPMPGMFWKSIGWLINPDSPLRIQPRFNIELIRWLARFCLSMNEPLFQRSVAALTEISKYSLDAYQQLDAEQPGQFGFSRQGLLMASQTQQGHDYAIREMQLVAKHGISGEVMDARQVREFEPAIQSAELAGGVYFPSEAHQEPLAAVQALARRATQHGATILGNSELFDFDTRARRVVAVRTTRGWLKADQFVLATGSWSNPLGRKLRLRVPILAGKGYAVVIEPLDIQPRRPLMLVEMKLAATPRANSLRLAGTLELVGPTDDTITVRRVDAILRGARGFLKMPAEPKIIEVWRGLRPCTPDGVPMIGHTPGYDNLLLAAGHQMLGLQSAPGTGRLIADLVAGTPPHFDPRPFRPDRF